MLARTRTRPGPRRQEARMREFDMDQVKELVAGPKFYENQSE
ncbi:hypothetical protein [Streptomyces sp. NPDC057199]